MSFCPNISEEDFSVGIALINPKSPQNVHSVLRAAGNFCIDYVGYTGSRYDMAINHALNITNCSRKVGKAVKLSKINSIETVISKDVRKVSIEFAEGAIPLPEYSHFHNSVYIFGPEDGSLSQDIIDLSDDVVFIPTVASMNLAASVNVVLYDRLLKLGIYAKGNEHIVQNRDINNRLKVKI